MITVFNRKELIVTFDMKEQSRIRTLLVEGGIDYSVKTVNRLSASPFSAGSRARTGTYGHNTEAMIEYVIYVKKADYERANRAIHKERKGEGLL